MKSTVSKAWSLFMLLGSLLILLLATSVFRLALVSGEGLTTAPWVLGFSGLVLGLAGFRYAVRRLGLSRDNPAAS